MQNECSRLKEILDAQIDIIERHVDDHKWFLQIEDRNEAIRDFIEKYGFIMREFYCSRVCEERFACKIASQYNLHPNQVSTWKRQLLAEGPTVFSQDTARQLQAVEEREADLYEQIGRLKMELEWLKKKAELLD